MTATLRETYIEGLMSAFQASGVSAKVERSLDVAFSREDGDVIIVHRGKEDPDNSVYGITDRMCDIMVSVLTRAAAPDKRADEIMVELHPLVVGYTADGIIDILEGQTDPPKFANTDGRACLITTHYTFHYRTAANSLSA